MQRIDALSSLSGDIIFGELGSAGLCLKSPAMTIWIEFIAQMTASTTNRWTGGTGSAFRIKRDPVKLLGKRRGPVNSTVLRLGCHDSANLISFLVLYFAVSNLRGFGFRLIGRASRYACFSIRRSRRVSSRRARYC